ncbi:MAG: hypothetical protein GX633_02010, partial [Clostridiales bacterium]|nr:hypothetical protein [Clostridiales bacterium]
NDTDKWISALETIIQFETQTSENLELAGEGIYSFSYVSDDCIAVNYYVAPTENVPAKIMLTCVLSEKCAERFALSGNGTAVYDLDRFYDFISVYDEINYYQTVENGVIEKYLAFKCNTDPRELIILVSVCDTYFNAYDSKYIRAGEITTDSEGITRIRMTNTLNSIMDSLKGSYAYPYTCLTIAAPYSEGKSQAYYAGQVLFSNMNTLGVTHNGKKSAEVGEMKKGENMIIGLDILDLYSAMEILNPDKALYTISYTMSDEKGSVCNGGFNLKVAGENMAPDEPFLINDLMSLNIENLSAFGELTADETVKPGVYTMCVVFKVYEDTGAEVYSEAKYVSFVLK